MVHKFFLFTILLNTILTTQAWSSELDKAEGILASDLKFSVNNSAVRILASAPLVEVEPRVFSLIKKDSLFELNSYRKRRNTWGHVISASYGEFKPEEYQIDLDGPFFDEIYIGGEKTQFAEISYALKFNSLFGSLGLEVGANYYKIESAFGAVLPSELTMIPIFLGLTYNLDSILEEPYIAPYIGGGIYSVLYKQTAKVDNEDEDEDDEDSLDFQSTDLGAYWKAGVSFQLNWLFKLEARNGYLESGIENTFFYLERRAMLASYRSTDPDFSMNQWNFGIKIEL